MSAFHLTIDVETNKTNNKQHNYYLAALKNIKN